MKFFILSNTLLLAALAPHWLPLVGAPSDTIQTFTAPPQISVETLPSLENDTTSAGATMQRDAAAPCCI